MLTLLDKNVSIYKWIPAWLRVFSIWLHLNSTATFHLNMLKERGVGRWHVAELSSNSSAEFMQVGHVCRRDKFHLQSPAAQDGAVLSDASLESSVQAFQTQSIIRRRLKPKQLGRTPLCSSKTQRNDYKAVSLWLMPEEWWLCLFSTLAPAITMIFWLWDCGLELNCQKHPTVLQIQCLTGRKSVLSLFEGFIYL